MGLTVHDGAGAANGHYIRILSSSSLRIFLFERVPKFSVTTCVPQSMYIMHKDVSVPTFHRIIHVSSLAVKEASDREKKSMVMTQEARSTCTHDLHVHMIYMFMAVGKTP